MGTPPALSRRQFASWGADMANAILSLPTWLSGILIIGGFTALSIGAMLLVRERVHRSMGEMHNEVAGFLIAVVGVMYAVLLAFLIIVDWEQFNAANSTVTNESSTLTSLSHETGLLPSSVRPEAQTSLRTYTSDVITREWKTMEQGNDSPAVDADLTRIYQVYDGLNRTGSGQGTTDESFRLLDQLSAQRTARVAASRESLNPVFWVVLILGAVVTVGYTILFYLDNVVIQALMTGGLAALIASLLFLLLVVDHPFVGDIHISSESLRFALEHMTAHPPAAGAGGIPLPGKSGP